MSAVYVSPDDIRDRFAAAMSDMYRREVPAYDKLVDLVETVNAEYRSNMTAEIAAASDAQSERFEKERHGAIRLGTADELSMMRRVFALMGMLPVGYYDLSQAGLPVHSTAFRPVTAEALSANPFRIFTSLLRLDMIEDEDLKKRAGDALAQRKIFSERAVELVKIGEAQTGLTTSQAEAFISEVIKTFEWHAQAQVSQQDYSSFLELNGLIADIVCFKGPHINHLTPRTLDIDDVQRRMPQWGLDPKAVIEGPPARQCPILLRQTSFRALKEQVSFRTGDGKQIVGAHTARFGEVEQRGAALTPKGRALYDELLGAVLAETRSASASVDYTGLLSAVFAAFPDDWRQMMSEGLAYFTFELTDAGKRATSGIDDDVETWIENGWVIAVAQTYEDFLPVSAAGIFRSNLERDEAPQFTANSNQSAFETALGASTMDPFALYQETQDRSLARCRAALLAAR